MPAGAGYRNKTRDLFSKKHRKHGMPSVGTYLRTFKLGEYVDIICDPAIQKGMPFKLYHGKIGRVWNVTKRAVGVEVNKRVRHRIFRKRLHVRVEHIRKSRCREDFLARVAEHDRLRKEAAKKGVAYVKPKREPLGPKDGFTLKGALNQMETIAPIPYDILKEDVRIELLYGVGQGPTGYLVEMVYGKRWRQPIFGACIVDVCIYSTTSKPSVVSGFVRHDAV